MEANGRRFVVANFEWSSLVRNWLAQLSNISVFPARPKGISIMRKGKLARRWNRLDGVNQSYIELCALQWAIVREY